MHFAAAVFVRQWMTCALTALTFTQTHDCGFIVCVDCTNSVTRIPFYSNILWVSNVWHVLSCSTYENAQSTCLRNNRHASILMHWFRREERFPTASIRRSSTFPSPCKLLAWSQSSAFKLIVEFKLISGWTLFNARNEQTFKLQGNSKENSYKSEKKSFKIKNLHWL